MSCDSHVVIMENKFCYTPCWHVGLLEGSARDSKTNGEETYAESSQRLKARQQSQTR